MITFLACWLAASIILGGGLARLAHLAKLRDQRAAGSEQRTRLLGVFGHEHRS